MSKPPKRLHWFDTAGGPHLILPAKYAGDWEGNAPPSGGRVVEATFQCDPKGPATDYDRAGSVSDPIETISVGRGQALVLGQGIFSTAYLRTPRGQHFLLRWIYANSEAELLDYFHELRARTTDGDSVEWRHPGGLVLLMDSGDTVRDPMTKPTEFALPRGKYRVSSVRGEEDPNGLVYHQLRRIVRPRDA